jgi:hypothetical protein
MGVHMATEFELDRIESGLNRSRRDEARPRKLGTSDMRETRSVQIAGEFEPNE